MPERLLKGWFGEVEIVKRIGTMTYVWAGNNVSVSAYRVRCKHGHHDVRSAASLRQTGQNTKCKRCRSTNRMKRLQLSVPPKRRGK